MRIAADWFNAIVTLFIALSTVGWGLIKMWAKIDRITERLADHERSDKANFEALAEQNSQTMKTLISQDRTLALIEQNTRFLREQMERGSHRP